MLMNNSNSKHASSEEVSTPLKLKGIRRLVRTQTGSTKRSRQLGASAFPANSTALLPRITGKQLAARPPGQ
jgi:hypothetical protein